jgi:hypothetical protein
MPAGRRVYKIHARIEHHRHHRILTVDSELRSSPSCPGAMKSSRGPNWNPRWSQSSQ